MNKLSQEYEINSILSTLESQAFIFSVDLDNNIKVRQHYQLECNLPGKYCGFVENFQ